SGSVRILVRLTAEDRAHVLEDDHVDRLAQRAHRAVGEDEADLTEVHAAPSVLASVAVGRERETLIVVFKERVAELPGRRQTIEIKAVRPERGAAEALRAATWLHNALADEQRVAGSVTDLRD